MIRYVMLILITCGQANAKSAAEKMGFIKSGECLDVRNINSVIIQKFDDHNYEIRGEGSLFERHAVLETKKAIYDSTGLPVGISVQNVGSKEMKLENGFSATYQVWRECKYDESIDCKPRYFDPNIAWPRIGKGVSCADKKLAEKKRDLPVGKSASCQDICFEKEVKKLFKSGETIEACLIEACK